VRSFALSRPPALPVNLLPTWPRATTTPLLRVFRSGWRDGTRRDVGPSGARVLAPTFHDTFPLIMGHRRSLREDHRMPEVPQDALPRAVLGFADQKPRAGGV
jgi:hypothetical protein